MQAIQNTGFARSLKVALLVGVASVIAAGCGSDSSSNPASIDTSVDVVTPRIVVTNAILGAVVAEAVGSDAVKVIIPNGKDPHDYEPSAQDVAEMMNADLIVETGLAYDVGLDKTIDTARDQGVVVFTAADYVSLKDLEGDVVADHEEEGHDEHGDHGEEGHDEHGDHGEEGHDEHGDHGEEGADPHFLSDPETMKQMVPALISALEEVTGSDLTATEEAVTLMFEQTHADVLSVMSSLGDVPCTLVTGHESLRYFADRYECEIVGAIIPGGSSTAEATAGALAELREKAEEAQVRAIFVDEGTPAKVANQIASEVGVEVYELSSHTVSDGGGYKAYVVAIAEVIVNGLSAE
jgi:zinc/manganese transport system substrate-binding protein